MKILVIGFGKIYIMTYMHFYLNRLKEHDCDVHLIYWDRDGKTDLPIPSGVTAHKFEFHINADIPRWKKLTAFWKFRKECKKHIELGNYDLAIVLTTPPGILLLDVLKKHFPKKYIFDFRDVTMENFWVFRKFVNRIIKYSAVTFVSSDAFRVHLLGNSIITSHNILLDALSQRDVRRLDVRAVSPIRIRYWGLIRHEEINKAIIDRLANDERFELHYHGREDGEALNLKAYCSQLGYKNIFFHGIYKPDERYEFSKNTDILHNIFENDKTMQPAMANKFYDGITMYIPQICNIGSHMGTQVREHRIGLESDPYSQSFADDLYAYYREISWPEFEKSCDSKLNEVMKEYNHGVAVIDDIVERIPTRS